MSVIRLPQPVRPAKPTPPDLGQLIDDLFELRGLLHQAQANERAMTAEVLQGLTAAGLDRYEAESAVAVLGQRVTLAPDPQLFFEALGPRAWGALTVTVTAARRLMGADDLAAISETTTSRVLRLEPREEPS
jgi:hypothetical protein